MKSELTSRQIFIFWFPLALSWLMMSVEGPFVAAVIARLADAKFNLAAHGVAFSFALIFEAPIISIAAATVALCKDEASYRKMYRFVSLLNLLTTALMLLMITPPVFVFIIEELIGLPEHIADLIHTALIILLPWPASIGFRRFYQGVLISRGQTRRVTYGTLVRLTAMSVTALILYQLNAVGVYTGAAALVMGVVSELIAVRYMAQSSIVEIKGIQSAPGHDNLERSYRYIARFYYPLALITILGLGVHPMVTFFMGKSRFPIESLAVLPVINALVFVFRSIGLSYQEAIIALLTNNPSNIRSLRRFSIGMGVVLIISFTLVAYTPLSNIWFQTISGLSPHLTEFTVFPVKMVAILPGLTAMITFQWGVLVQGEKTSPISKATIFEVLTILATLFIMVRFIDMIGVNAAAIAFVIGSIVGNLYLMPFTRRQVAQIAS